MLLAIAFALIFLALLVFVFLKKNKREDDSEFIPQQHVVPKSTPVENKAPSPRKSFEGSVDKYGLYPIELLVLLHAPNYYVDERNFPSFWRYKYEIENVIALLENLVQRGFLKKEMDLKANLGDLNVPDLKCILKNNSLPVSGKKEEIVKRILENIPKDSLDNSLTKKRYLRTEKGDASLQDAPYVAYLDTHSLNVSLFELSDFMSRKPSVNFKEGILELLKKDIKKHQRNSDYGMYRNAQWAMMEFYKAENRLADAYFTLLEIIFIDINDFLGNGFSKDLLQMNIEMFFKDEPVVTIPPAAFELMDYFQSSLNVSDQQLRLDMMNRWFDVKIPYHVLSVGDCIEIYFSEKNDDLSKIKEIFSIRKSQNLMDEKGVMSLVMGRLESGYRNLYTAQELSDSRDYLRARTNFMKSVESFKQAGATIELEKTIDLYKRFVKKDPIFKGLTNVLLNVINQNPGILQSDIAGRIESEDWSAQYDYNRPIIKDDVYYVLYFADEFGLISRKKKGRTYELYVEK
ncbi:MAG: SAP domain-containing protein [Fibrobacter sp.]|nr:SAP domain-containing protein [Fibrobacter sp.]